jgi:glutamate N-acetyltransferase / amino-acid N-acetyltransferase
MAKGAGMIHPNMATMLCILATDAAVAPGALTSALRYAADRSFNAISVDGDSSTNDSMFVLANGQAGPRISMHAHRER